MKRITAVTFLAALAVSLWGCGGNADEGKKLKEDYSKVTVDGLRLEILGALDNKLDGLSTEWDPFLLTPANMANPNIPFGSRATADDFTLVCNRAKQMGLHKIRVMLQPQWIEPVKGAYTWDGAYAQMLLKMLDFCETEGIKVNLVTWGANTDAGYFMGLASGQWISAPKDLDEYVANMVYSADYLLNTKKYTCITEICPFNEPDYFFIGDGGGNKGDLGRYAELCKKLDQGLKNAGLRDKVKLNLADCGRSENTISLMEKIGGIADVYNTHCYDYYSDTINELMYDYSRVLAMKAAEQGAIHTMGEVGFRTTIGSKQASDIDTYERGLGLMKLVTNFLNGGSAGLSYWCLFDQYYDLGAERMEVGLWKFKDKEWEARPQFYAYSLLTKYSAAGAEIYKIKSADDNICAVALKNPDGSWTYVVVNSSAQAKEFSFTNSNLRNLTVDKYVYTASKLPVNGRTIPSAGKAEMKEFVLSDTVPGLSAIVYSNKG